MPYTEAYKPLDDYHDKTEINSILTELENVIQSRINNTVNKVYPVGSVYMSINNTNPQVLFGGEWERIENSLIVGGGSTINNYYWDNNSKSMILDYGDSDAEEQDISQLHLYMWKRTR